MMDTMKRLSLVALVALGSSLITTSFRRADDDKSKDRDLTDEQFIQKASECGLAEVNHGRVAAQKATRPEVKQFAQRLVQDHSQSNAELIALANRKGLAVARDMGKKHTEMAEKMAQLQGADFDRQYMQHMVEGHQKAVELFEREAKHSKDADVKAFAEKTLPTLKEHLKMSKEVAGNVKGNTGEK